MNDQRRGFTPIELLLAISAAPILIALLLPAIAEARTSAKETQSIGNLRQISAACFTYATEWRDRQYQATMDDLTSFGDSLPEAVEGYARERGELPSIWLGWDEEKLHELPTDGENSSLLMPITFDADPFGYCRLPNARALSQYLNYKFYDSVFYAPKDKAVLKCVEDLFDDPGEYIPVEKSGGMYWSSYCLSPAALMDPQVMRGASKGGFVDPFTLPTGLRAPGIDQADFSDLKTHIMEHHWLQRTDVGLCNPAFEEGTYNGCEPYYFNASLRSQPLASFYDGHVESIDNAKTHADDERMRNAGEDGMWLRQPGGAATGYYEDKAAEQLEMSHHIYTRDGIKGRDMIGR